MSAPKSPTSKRSITFGYLRFSAAGLLAGLICRSGPSRSVIYGVVRPLAPSRGPWSCARRLSWPHSRLHLGTADSGIRIPALDARYPLDINRGRGEVGAHFIRSIHSGVLARFDNSCSRLHIRERWHQGGASAACRRHEKNNCYASNPRGLNAFRAAKYFKHFGLHSS
jgi:hypothetical protein